MTRGQTILWLVIALVTVVPVSASAPGLAVIMHPNRKSALTFADLANIYLRKRRFWDDGALIVPLNREPGSVARETFSKRVLGGDSADFSAYWNRQYFHGVFPPVTLSSSAAIKRYVAAEPNAVGYVEAGDVDETVKVALRLE